MNDINKKTIEKINEKLNWAIYSHEFIKQSNQTLEITKYNFWSFITAFQQSWYYYNHMIGVTYNHLSKTAKGEKANEIINNWKRSYLSITELIHWDLINKIRNFDTHTEPMIPEIKEKILRITHNNKFVTHQGKFVVITVKQQFIEFESNEYNIVNIANDGISAIKKLLEFIPTIEKES